MLYLNLEDERLLGFGVPDFDALLQAHAEITGRYDVPALFLDEVRNVEGWEGFALRLADAGVEVFLAASGAERLGMETEVTSDGRFVRMEIMPLGFAECLDRSGIRSDPEAIGTTAGRAAVVRAFGEYLEGGGFPKALGLGSQRRECLSDAFQSICLIDIVGRHRVRNVDLLKLLLKETAERLGKSVSYSQLTKAVAAMGTTFSKTACVDYVRYACEAGLAYRVGNLVGKGRRSERLSKLYFVDNGILTLFQNASKSALLGNAVALELIRRYGSKDEVFFYGRDVEVDFYVPEAKLALQVCARLGTDPKTLEREIGALVRMGNELPCARRVVVTLEEERTVETECGKVEVVPAWKWLLEKPQTGTARL